MAPSGAQIIARILRDLGVTVVFGIVGIPVVEIAEEAINLGIRFIGFRNEQAASYAATAYGYLTGRPGVCLVVGGPGVLHTMAGESQIGNSSINAWPLLLLAGSSETHLVHRGAFQELDAISLLAPHTKISVRPPSLEHIPGSIRNAYRSSWYGRPGTGFVDLPADIIQGTIEDSDDVQALSPVPHSPAPGAEETTIFKIAQLLKAAKAPLTPNIHRPAPLPPFADGQRRPPRLAPLNTASARSTALREADVVLVLGARLNWIFHFGDAPKWNPAAQFIQVDIDAQTLGLNNPTPHLSLWGDLRTIVPQISSALGTWHYDPNTSPFTSHLSESRNRNLETAAKKAAAQTQPMTYALALSTIERTLHRLSPPDEGGIVYVSEGANTMDISRSIFPVSHPRLRLDAGTHATMGVGLGYAIAAWEAYNGAAGEGNSGPPQREGNRKGKKVVCVEGDSAFGFSAMEIETMARYGMDVLVFVVNNGGVYHGDSDSADEWLGLQRHTLQQSTRPVNNNGSDSKSDDKKEQKKGLRSTSLGFEIGYEKLAHACGGSGYLVRTPDELANATEKGFRDERVCVVNVIVEAGKGAKLEFGWQASGGGKRKRKGKEKREGSAKL
ncbi:hypothetical protein G7Y79_00004g015070 [Physcia stellaris]|nr:hypothetical protein G7Y79_00004g015070 [Physcia stellaris]